MKEAMQKVKAELGADAVILHTKKYREGGIFGTCSRRTLPAFRLVRLIGRATVVTETT